MSFNQGKEVQSIEDCAFYIFQVTILLLPYNSENSITLFVFDKKNAAYLLSIVPLQL